MIQRVYIHLDTSADYQAAMRVLPGQDWGAWVRWEVAAEDAGRRCAIESRRTSELVPRQWLVSHRRKGRIESGEWWGGPCYGNRASAKNAGRWVDRADHI